LFRRVSANYKVDALNVTLPENMNITIPVYAIHHDKDIYPNPEVYDPDRFSPENIKTRNPYAFLPFGAGARNCIGIRFGMMQARIGLAVLLNNFKFSRCSKSVVPLVILTRNFILTPKDGLWLKVERV
jgi:cytochrome P450 family 6